MDPVVLRLVENYTNALRIVRKYVLEFFQPLAAPPNNQKTNNELKRLQWGQVMDTARYRARRRGNNKIAPTRRRRRSRTVWDHGDSGTQRMSSIGGDSAELRRNAGQRTRKRKQPKGTRRGAGVTRGTSGTTSTPGHKERGKTEATEPNAGPRTREIHA